MGREISRANHFAKPALPMAGVVDAVRRLRTAIETDPSGHISILSRLAPSEHERAILEDRERRLREASTPVSQRGRDVAIAVTGMVLKMFYAWPTIRLDEDKAAGVAEAYVAQIKHLPLWAIEEGIAECQGRKEAFAPSAGVLRSACEAKMNAVSEELDDLRKMLTAEPYNPTPHGDDAKKRVHALAKSMRERACTNEPFRASDYGRNPDAEAQRQIEEFECRRVRKVDHSRPLEVSSNLRARLAQPEPDMAREVGNEWRE